MPLTSLASRARAGLFLGALLFAAWALAACSLAGDVTPPPGWRATQSAVLTQTPAATIAAGPAQSAPASRPVALDGGYVYQEHCAACHGPAGNGGGSMTAQLPGPVPDFSSTMTLRGRSPQELFATISQGRLEAFMPPFAASLSVVERWNAVVYLHTLSLSAENLQAGRAVFEATCARCHGQTGKGDGPDAAGLTAAPRDLTQPDVLAGSSQAGLMTSLTSGSGAHAELESLTDDQRWAALDYARSLSYDYSPPEAASAERLGTVEGKLINGTAGEPQPGSMEVSLHAFEGQALITTLTTTAGADGAFHFGDVAYKPGRRFVAATRYAGFEYDSEPLAFSASDGVLSVSLPVYETTTDPSGLTVGQVHTFLEFTGPSEITVGQLFVFSNGSDRAYLSEPGQAVPFDLPAAYANLNVQGAQLDQDYFMTASGFSLRLAVPHGEATHQVLFSYRLPYAGRLGFAQVFRLGADAYDLLVSDLGVKVVGPGLTDTGVQTFQGAQFQTFAGTALAPGATLAFDVSGRAGQGSSAAGGQPLDSRGLAIGLGAILMVAAGIGFWMYRRQPSPRLAGAPTVAGAGSRDALLRAIADLDDLFDQGKLDEAVYYSDRTLLKDRLKSNW